MWREHWSVCGGLCCLLFCILCVYANRNRPDSWWIRNRFEKQETLGPIVDTWRYLGYKFAVLSILALYSSKFFLFYFSFYTSKCLINKFFFLVLVVSGRCLLWFWALWHFLIEIWEIRVSIPFVHITCCNWLINKMAVDANDVETQCKYV